MNDRTRVTVRLAAPRELAFAVFTTELDGWWRRGRRYRMAESSTLTLEPGVGGRLRETVSEGGEQRVYELGEVQAWEPPARLVLAWRAVNFGPADPSTEVEVTFERALGPGGEATLVTVEHRGWSRVRPDHPVRHGQEAAAFLASMGRWWGDLLSHLRERVG